MRTLRAILLQIIASCCMWFASSAQTDSLYEQFKTFDLKNVHNSITNLTARVVNEELIINCAGKKNWEDTRIDLGVVDLSVYQSISFRVKSNANVTVRTDLVDQNGATMLVSNAIPVSKSIKGDNQWNYIYFELKGHFDQAWPSPAKLDPRHITGLSIILNPGGQFAGEVVFDDLALGKKALKPEKKRDKYINVNQVGFYPAGQKIAVVCGSIADDFTLINARTNKKVYEAKLSKKQYWNYADDSVKVADFSSFTDTGSYFVQVVDLGNSPRFAIRPNIFKNLATASIKALYYQRSGCDINEKYAGKWHRPAGTPDTAVYVHPAAATAKRPAESKFSSLRGWYDAGDYNKYIVNSGITMYTLMAAIEQYPDYTRNLKLHIPESGNSLPDLLDEILWNLRWMLTMQDTDDGGVYHKLTHANFEPMALPHEVKERRYLTQKSTAATLDFCAVMAQASRVLKPYGKELPGLADSCMSAAARAWSWAKKNPKVYYDQFANNTKYSPKIFTGIYGDGYVFDEFDWAGSEMLLSTGNEVMLDDIKFDKPLYMIPEWGNVQALGLISLAYYRKFVSKQIDTNSIKEKIISLADSLVIYSLSCPFRTTMGQAKWHFAWGSNAVAANSTMFLLQAYNLTKERKYYDAALNNFSYILGCNPTGYCFVTGFGTKSPQFIHHRPSEADGIAEPVPGMLVGGPYPGRDDGCWYPWDAPAKNYSDDVCSYSTNEIAINWNAPLAYLACAFESIENKMFPSEIKNPRTKLVFPEIAKLPKLDSAQRNEYSPIIVYPNMKTGSLRVQLALLEPAVLEIKDADGRVIVHDYIEKTGSIPRSYPINLQTGTYIVTLVSKNLNKTHTVMINP